mmetsp:Transcript_15904/g.41237  ORF Transcript_15904/g.41237 Transcript_15904/m.41237 type:complete len:264 (+) Transcript_15904:302-1093(+)
MTMTVPLKLGGSFSRAASMSSSLSKQRATPSKTRPSLPVILATEPSGARLPYRIWMWPSGLMGVSSGMITCWPSLRSGQPARFSAIVLPVTVMQEPSMKPFCMRYLSTAGVPPTLCRSSMTYLPEGFRSAMKGTRLETFWKSSMLSGTLQALAIASRCSTALVEPPVAMMSTIAFSNAARVMMSRGLRSIFMRLSSAAPAIRHSSRFRGSSAGMEEEYGNVMPIASMAEAMVLAVYMPPQAPAPGHELRTMSKRSFSSISPAL